MPFGYASPEQIMRDKADYARKGIARGRSVVVLQYEHGILFVAPNPSRALHKISEIYDRIGFAAVGRYNEFEALRLGGIRYADINGYTYDRSDVTARGLANLYAQNLGQIFTESIKSFEVEVVVAEVGDTPETDAIYRLTFDGSVFDEHGMAVMGGQAEAVTTRLKEHYREGMTLAQALEAALAALTEPGGERPPVGQLEVAVLDRNREHRKFQRLVGSRLETLLAEAAAGRAAQAPPAESESAPGAVSAPESGAGPADGPATGPEGDIDTGSGG
ncbi:proteasome subunit alpha [Planomonospora sp. ID91781]|uniref:Proteasome subunit alpha n=1 Tax=Planomonospora sphaerica TaxID=161355 RepID=A0A171DIF0_9ACTN|nr:MULTISPECIES: proteasome subunit alpha [Planomonospora]MBG0823747.1 proteasome subunit alpha [Planomonospora sp. ID91781]GAT68686.1 proteasome subunit alpha [Planomonospora sphaerica]